MVNPMNLLLNQIKPLLTCSAVEKGAIQCGYCTPGMIMSAKNLLDTNANPTEQEIRKGISGNLCRCTGYQKIFEAIKSIPNTQENK